MILKRIGYAFGMGTLISMSSWFLKAKEGFWSSFVDWLGTVYSWPLDGISGSKNQLELPFRYLDPEKGTLGSTCIMTEATKDAWLYWNPVWRGNSNNTSPTTFPDCKYTCHYKCLNDVGLDCTESPELRKDTPDHSPQHTLVSVEDIENELESFVFLTREELEPKIDKFNTLRSQKSESLTLNEEGTLFSGRVTVHINLSRPVSVRTGCPLPDICVSTLKQYEHSIDTNKRRTTFFMPKATSQELNITCYTTAQDVIRNVLAGLQLIDNPRKFALFEKTEYNGEVFMRKMVDEDKPLYMCLSWVSSTGNKRFELRENETGVIEWEAFTVPELQNFLRILDKEEEEYIQAVRRKYIKYQNLLQEAMDSTTTKQEQVAPVHQKSISA
ncbi:ras association domain-containing protein 5-like isoform X1 [Lytechinus pictus]|uniref:ras association domain-containing protein 5-like isoform X1 n=1 Tax=Lytechinus pictus TaxID=7653 RepID=UPI0030B9B466